MLQTFEVEIDADGRVRALGPLGRIPPGRALLALLAQSENEAAFLEESALAKDWLRPEEDAAWACLQRDK